MRSRYLLVFITTGCGLLGGCAALAGLGGGSSSEATRGEPSASDARDQRKALVASLAARSEAMRTIVEEGRAPIDDAALAGWDGDVASLVALVPDAGLVYGPQRWAFGLYNARFAGAGAAGGQAQQLGAELVTSGQATGAELTTKVTLSAGKCYGLAGRRVDGGEVEVAWRTGDVASPLAQPFEVRVRAAGFVLKGVCASEAGTLEVRATWSSAGSGRPYDWFVVAWDRARVPEAVLDFWTAAPADPCDATAYIDSWTNPGPLARFEGARAPYRLLYEDGNFLRGESPWGREDRIAFDEIATARRLDAPAAWELQTCRAPDVTRDADAKALSRCELTLAERMAERDAAQSDIEAADTPAEVKPLLRRRAAAEKAIAAQEKLCAPLRKRVRARMNEAYIKVIDQLRGETVAAQSPMLARWQARRAADLALTQGL